jgi:hypothetical protein
VLVAVADFGGLHPVGGGGDPLFDDESLFVNATGPLTLESFETLPVTKPFPGNSNTIVTSGFTITNSPGTNDFDVWDEAIPLTFHPTHGQQSLVWYANVPSTSVTFTFPAAINAFGINIVDAGDPSTGPVALTFATDGGDAGIAAVGPRLPDNEQFFGIVGAPFTTITFTRPDVGDASVFDEVRFGIVPEPGALVLAMAAWWGMAWRRKYF